MHAPHPLQSVWLMLTIFLLTMTYNPRFQVFNLALDLNLLLGQNPKWRRKAFSFWVSDLTSAVVKNFFPSFLQSSRIRLRLIRQRYLVQLCRQPTAQPCRNSENQDVFCWLHFCWLLLSISWNRQGNTKRSNIPMHLSILERNLISRNYTILAVMW